MNGRRAFYRGVLGRERQRTPSLNDSFMPGRDRSQRDAGAACASGALVTFIRRIPWNQSASRLQTCTFNC